MTVLITGGTGFLGSHLLKAIIEFTSENIVVLKRSFSNLKRIEELKENPRVKFYDVDKVDVEEAFKNNNIETIIHCATNYGRGDESCHNILDTNLMFPIKLLDLSVKWGTKTFINTDSFFNKENFSYSYLLNYSLSKKSLLLWLKYFSHKIKVVNMVLEHIYGGGDSKSKFVYQMIDKIAINKQESIDLTKGEQKRDFIYVDDVVSAYLKVLEFTKNSDFSFKSFDVGCGVAVSLKDFVSAIKEISNSPTKLNFGALPYREDEIVCSKADISELTKLGWQPKYLYKDGLKKYIEEF